MKNRHILSHSLWLIGIVVLLYGCAGSTGSQGQLSSTRVASPSAPSPAVSPSAPASIETPSSSVRQLKAEGTLPSSCSTSPVYQGGPERFSGASGLPWIQAQPATSGIFAYLFYGQTVNTKQGTYRFIHTGGGWGDGSTTKILWIITHPQSASPLQINGTNLSDRAKTFHQTFDGAAEVPSIVVVPYAGCWRLQITSGNAHGTIVMWAVGKN